MTKLRGSVFTTLGAVTLTVLAATAALAVNAGILRSAPDSGVGDLESVATTVPSGPQDPNIRYVTVFVDDPAPGSATVSVPVTAAAPTATTPGVAGIPGTDGGSRSLGDDGDEFDEAEDHGRFEDSEDDHDRADEAEDHGRFEDSEDDHDRADEDDAYEGSDDDD